jgi:hypothetical protein
MSDIDAGGRTPRRDATANREALLAAAAAALGEASDASLERITAAAGLTRRPSTVTSRTATPWCSR